MDGSDYLYTCAEVAVALAGFSALVVAITGRDSPAVDQLFRGIVGTIVERSLAAIFFSLGPILLLGLEIDPAFVWSICSGGLAIYITSLAWRSASLRRREPLLVEFLAGPTFLVLMGLGLVVLVLQTLNATGLLIEKGVWWYLVGLTWLLLAAAYMFYLAVRRWARAT